jgi:glycosyltransferase involved in cell wall biosynthesis
MDKKKISLSVPCYLRPQRTIRAINCVANQTINNWEAFFIGDGCPVMNDFLQSQYCLDIVEDCKSKGNKLFIQNHPINRGGHGFAITNENIARAKGEFFMFFANDDIILPNHFENYLSAIDNSEYDFVFFDSYVKPNNMIRNAQLQYGCIGHSELIVRTEFLKKMPNHNEHYGHDWNLIYEMAKVGNYTKAHHNLPTYHVMSLSDNREKDID